MSVRILTKSGFSDEIPVFIAVDDALRCPKCGRRPAGIGTSAGAARACLARMGKCDHGGPWYRRALRWLKAKARRND